MAGSTLFGNILPMPRRRRAPPTRSVCAIAYDGLTTFEFGVAVEVFGLPRPELGVDWYEFSVCAADSGRLRASGGVFIQATAGLDALATAGTIVIPGWRDVDETPPKALLDAIVAAHENGARLVSICSGVFVLAAAGLLDGLRATTHWRYAGKLAARYPKIRVDPDVLYVDEGDVLTSAGSAAGIDLCLHVVRLDYGAAVASSVARRLVVPPHRDGGQAQYVAQPVTEAGDGSLAEVIDWTISRLDQPLSVAEIARRAHMSQRTFARRFKSQTGTTPNKWLVQQRLAAAQRLLETTELSIDDVARRSGLGSPESLRHHFRAAFGTTPTGYRHRFRR